METTVQLKAFVGHSFADKDETLVNKIITFLGQSDIVCKTGEKAQNKSVSQKVKDRIDECDLFVGVFTRHEELCELPIKKNFISFFCKVKPSGKFTTSNWVIQECGYAIGKGKPTLLMVENGIHKFPELQGDQEIIFFQSSNLEGALLRLLTMLHDIKSKYYQLKPMTAAVTAATAPGSETREAKKEETPQREETDAFIEMFNAIRNKDISRMETVYKDKLRETLDSRQQEAWDAFVLRHKYLAGDASAFEKLKELAEKNQNPDVQYQLAICFAFGEKYQEAIAVYSKLTGDKISAVTGIAECRKKLEGAPAAIQYLLGEIGSHPEYSENEDILTALIGLAKNSGDDFLYVLFCERFLAVQPVNKSVRFDLAFKYSNIGEDNLAVYHYKKYLENNDSPSGLNNIAVSFNTLDLNARAVEFYERSKDKNETLAMANLANKYVNEGFIEEAENLVKSAEELSVKGVEVHQNIGAVKKRIKDLLEEESKKETEITAEAEKIHRFRVQHANSFCLRGQNQPVGTYSKTVLVEKWGAVPVNFNFDKGKFEGTLKTRVEESLLSSLLAFQGVAGTKSYKIREVQINGDFRNLAGRYMVKVTDTKESSSYAPTEEVFSAKGLFIIKEDLSRIEVLETDKDKKKTFKTWELSNSSGN